MGDIIKLTTPPEEQQTIYRVPVGGLKFSVKGQDNAAIGILSKPDLTSVVFWIVLGERETWITHSSRCGKIVQTPQILSPDEFRSFWISWTSLAASLGQEGEEEPIATWRVKLPGNLCYATFFVSSGGNEPLEWKFELAPEIPRPVERNIDGGEVKWVRSEHLVPWNAVIGGYENETLYIIRAHHRGSLAVGKFIPSRGVGYIAWGSMAHTIDFHSLEFLVGYDCRWVQTSGSRIPVDAIIGGYTEHHRRENIYVGRARCERHLIPGKVHKMYQQCYTPYKDREVAHKNYEVLVSSEINQRSINRRYTKQINVERPRESGVEVSDDDAFDDGVDMSNILIEEF